MTDNSDEYKVIAAWYGETRNWTNHTGDRVIDVVFTTDGGYMGLFQDERTSCTILNDHGLSEGYVPLAYRDGICHPEDKDFDPGAYVAWYSEFISSPNKPAPDWSSNEYIHNQTLREMPDNNDGRQLCAWCWEPTKRVQGFMSEYDVCPKCQK